MNTPETIAVRIQFQRETQNDHGHITHQPGEVICGQVIGQRGDFLLVRTPTGNCMYVDASRRDVYCVELQDTAEEDMSSVLRVRDLNVTSLVAPQAA
jgi:hypothetical protein